MGSVSSCAITGQLGWQGRLSDSEWGTQQADSRDGIQRALEEADWVPLRSQHSDAGMAEVPAAGLGERKCVISPIWPIVSHAMVLKSKGFGVRPACVLNPAVNMANNNWFPFHPI